MADNPAKGSQEEPTNTEISNNHNLDEKETPNDSNSPENVNNISDKESNTTKKDNKEEKEDHNDSIAGSNNDNIENKEQLHEYAETQNVDIDNEKVDYSAIPTSQPNINEPRGLTGKANLVKKHKKIEAIKLEDIPLWSDYAPSVLQGKRLPKQEDLLFPPNDSINRLISYIPHGDSTILAVDAIVNAANSGLYAGGGICGAIHHAAGPELEEACMEIGGCQTGNAVITPGFNLPSKYVIHAVGPIGKHPKALESAYQKTLELMDGTKVRSVALCCISTGIYGYPIRPATKIALNTVRTFLENEENRKKVDRIIFVVFNPKDCSVYESFLPYYFPLPEGAIKGAEEDDVNEEEEEEEEEDALIEIRSVDENESSGSSPTESESEDESSPGEPLMDEMKEFDNIKIRQEEGHADISLIEEKKESANDN